MTKQPERKITDVNLSKVSKEVLKVVKKTDTESKVIDNAKITFDGKQYLVRIPKNIADIMEISDKDSVQFEIILAENSTKAKPQLTMYLERDKRVRQKR